MEILGIDYHWFLIGLTFILNTALVFIVRHLRARLGSENTLLSVVLIIVGFVCGGLALLGFTEKSYLGFWVWWSAWDAFVFAGLIFTLGSYS